MANFTIEQFESFQLEKPNLGSIRDAINETTFEDESFSRFVTITKAKQDDPIALLGEMDDVGKAGSGCKPTYEEKGIANSMKRWELGDWQIPISICYEAMLGTIAQYSLKDGTDVGDLQGTDIMTIYTAKLQDAIQKFIWRVGWFGDNEAQTVEEGGKITNGVKTDLFTICDGLWKRIFKQCTSNAKQYTEISANKQATAAKQRETILAKGYMTDFLDKALMDVDSRITTDGNATLMMTSAMADALAYDVKKSYNIIIPWEKVFTGFEVSSYNGIKVARVSIWDRMIAAYEKGTATVNLPYRAVFANPKQLLVGTPKDLVSQLDIWFDKKERQNYIYATGKLGTSLLEDNLVHAMY